MRYSGGSVRAVSPASSPTGWRWAIEGAVLALVLASCGGAAAPAATYPQDVSYEDHGSVSQSGIQQERPAIAVAVDAAAKTELAALAATDKPVPEGRIAIAVFQGQQRTGGYSVRVDKVTRRTAT